MRRCGPTIRVFLVSGIVLASVICAGAATTNPHGSNFDINCEACHVATSWQELKKPLDFNHDKTGFPLIGVHDEIKCTNCHGSLEFVHIGIACADCHTDVHRGQFGLDCAACHISTDWQDRQDILTTHAERGFPLIGVHALADCQSCHLKEGREEFAGTPVACEGCHFDNFQLAENPNHARAGFALDCSTCHLPIASSWQNVAFEHPTVFQLRGAHAQLDCNSCHASQFAGTPTVCYNCHESDYLAVDDPPHGQLGFPTDCEVCHTEIQWSGATFDHLGASGFELRGAHALLECNVCHAENQYDLPQECFGCHQTDYSSVDDPNHVTGNFPHDCTFCHGEVAWSPANFNHDQTNFPLTGAHGIIACTECHINNQYAGTPTDCWSCHETDYLGVNEPSHVQNNFSQDCTQCHNTAAWEPASFDHAQTDFPLTGAHVSLNCIECHAGGYSNIPTECFACHESDYNDVDDPNHVTNNFDHDCTMCHNTAAWEPASFDHAQTDFPLTGAHVSLNCIQCHAGGYDNTPTECFACHETDFNDVDDPDHVANNFDHDCTMCHTTAAWEPASFDHSQTDFPLTGAHVSLNCIQCHAGGYNNTPTECFACHESDYNDVDDPDHVANDFDHVCTVCHNTDNWETETFDHNITDFPLTGAHITVPCQSCHSGGYDNTPMECFACHESDYNNANNPDHNDGFPTDCERCHNTNAWDDTNWNHDTQYFPIYSGRHDDEWNICADCHVNPNDYEVFECIFCHEHNQQDTDDEHDEVPGYSYDSQACYTCHPTGEE